MAAKKSIENLMNLWEDRLNVELPKKFDIDINAINSIANKFTAGRFCYFIVNFETLKFEYFHPNCIDILGFKPEEITIELFLSLLHPDDAEVMSAKEALVIDFILNFMPSSEMKYYKPTYTSRIKSTGGEYITMLHQTTTLTVSDDGIPQQVLGVYTDLSHLNVMHDNKVSLIGIEGRKSYMGLDPFKKHFEPINEKEKYTERELKVLLLLSEGKSVVEIAKELFISANTVKYHKKNLAKKSDTSNTAQLIVYAVRNGLLN